MNRKGRERPATHPKESPRTLNILGIWHHENEREVWQNKKRKRPVLDVLLNLNLNLGKSE